MQINTNISSVISANALQSASTDIKNSVQRISTGVKLSQDDPSSIGTSARLKAQIGSLTKANDSINKGMGALQMMDSSLSEITSMLLGMKDLAVASNNAMATTEDKAANQLAYSQLLTAITTASTIPKLGSSSLIASTAGMTFRVGATSTDTLAVPTYDTQAAALSLTGTDVSAGAAAAETALDAAINTVTGYQAKVGGSMKVLDSLANVNDAVITGATSAYSSLTSTDLAKETANLAASQIRQNAAAAMFAQSNTMSREVVGYLLKGV
jgi:flagellin